MKDTYPPLFGRVFVFGRTVTFFLGAAACGTQGGGDTFGNLPDGGQAGLDSGVSGDAAVFGDGGGGFGDGGAVPDGGGCEGHAQGCPCPSAGVSVACWTGPPANRGVGQCKDGTQTCVATAEFGQWGPCVGEVLDCGVEAGMPEADVPEVGPPEASVPDGGVSDSCRRLGLAAHGNLNGMSGGSQYDAAVCIVTATGALKCDQMLPNKPASVRCVSGGEEYMCVVTAAGAAECWGYVNGLEGIPGNTPAIIPGLESGVVDIAGGETHVCVLMNTGAVECWGWSNGEVNTGSWTPPTTPTVIAGLGPDVKSLTSGDGFSCVLLASGTIQCWGSNLHGELGDGTTNDSATPVIVTGLPQPAIGVWADQSTHPCALLQDGSVWCWGSYSTGTSPSGPTASLPVQETGFAAGVTALACGDESTTTCALLTTTGVQCWGSGASYGPGGMTFGSPTPVDELSSGVVELRSSDDSACALMATDTVQCWGDLPGGPYPITLQ
jgi:hypothetical protein